MGALPFAWYNPPVRAFIPESPGKRAGLPLSGKGNIFGFSLVKLFDGSRRKEAASFIMMLADQDKVNPNEKPAEHVEGPVRIPRDGVSQGRRDEPRRDRLPLKFRILWSLEKK